MPARERVKTRPDHGEEDSDGDRMKDGHGWSDACELLYEIQAIDSHVGWGKDDIPPVV